MSYTIEHADKSTIIAADTIVIAINDILEFDPSDENYMEELIDAAKQGAPGFTILWQKGDGLVRTEPHITF